MPTRSDVPHIVQNPDLWKRAAAASKLQMDHGYQEATPGYPAFASKTIKDNYPNIAHVLEATNIPIVSDAASLAIGLKEGHPALGALAALPFVPGITGKAGRTLIHGSPNPDMTLEGINIFRDAPGTKQGRRYGGFYGYDPSDVTYAKRYAEMGQGTPSLYDIQLHPDARFKTLGQGEGEVTRLSRDQVKALLDQGYHGVTGTSPLGKTEHAIIDKGMITGFKKRDQY